MFSLIRYYFSKSKSRTLHQKPQQPPNLGKVLVLVTILSLILVAAALLAATEGPHYYQIGGI